MIVGTDKRGMDFIGEDITDVIKHARANIRRIATPHGDFTMPDLPPASRGPKKAFKKYGRRQ